jgi:hypothetical protein
MIKSSTRTLLSSLVVATAVLSAVPVTTAQARDFRDSPIYQNHQGDLLRLQESRRTKYRCNWNNGLCPNPGPLSIYPTTEPGSFWRLTDICDYLEGVSCFIDTYDPDGG